MEDVCLTTKQQGLLAAVLVISFLVFVSCVMAQSPDNTRDMNKIFRISASFTSSAVTPAATALEYGYGPVLQPAPGFYTGRIISSDGSNLQEFALSNPRIWRGDEAAVDEKGRVVSFSGLLEEKERVDSDIVFPYHDKAAGFRIIESGTGATKADIDLIPAVTAFCRQYPDDQDCRSRSTGREGVPPVLIFACVGLIALCVVIILKKRRQTTKK
jgi:hypothetical protein